MDISVIGLGRLGCPWAAVLASKGHRVIGVDTSAAVVGAVNDGRSPVLETGLRDLIAANRARLSATQDARAAALQTDVSFIIVGTPSNPAGAFSLAQIESVIDALAPVIGEKKSYHLVVLTSTVMAGDTGGRIRSLLESRSGKQCGRDFGLCYSPEFVALGSVIQDMLHPDMVLIGESDKRAGDLLESIYRTTCENSPVFARMNFVNAEITKLAVNTFVTTKMSYANMLARVCERLDGADVDVVTTALAADSRIGHKYFKGAVSYGGPCFPRDNVAFAVLASRLGTSALLAQATHDFNRQQVGVISEIVRSKLPAKGCVGILGLSYKPGTDVHEASFGMALTNELTAAGVDVVVYDPAALASARHVLPQSVQCATSRAECTGRADVLVIATPWPEFRDLQASELKSGSELPTIIDCWRILDLARFATKATVIVCGVGPEALR